jgi:hypothetical protein
MYNRKRILKAKHYFLKEELRKTFGHLDSRVFRLSRLFTWRSFFENISGT